MATCLSLDACRHRSDVRRLRCFYAVILAATCLALAWSLFGHSLPRNIIVSLPANKGTAAKEASKPVDGLLTTTPTVPEESRNGFAGTAKEASKDDVSLTTTLTVPEESRNGSAMSSEPVNKALTRLQRLPWTSLCGTNETDSYHFFSAYYDDRKSVPQRPAVLVLGYVYKQVNSTKMYCLFKYSNGTKICSKTPVEAERPCAAHDTPGFIAKPHYHLCRVSTGEEPPVAVQLSTSSSCEPLSTSGEIPVLNRKREEPTKKFGVCIGGPLIQESRGILNDLIQLIEMTQLLGAEFIVFYANETQVDRDILQYLWTHYPDTVRTIGWKKFSKWMPFHYFGQPMILADCHNRVMHEVEYLVIMDLDEMILPVKHNNWKEMLNAFRANDDVSTFKFQNNFFDDPNPLETRQLHTANASQFVSKYFTRTRRYICQPGFIYRTKVICQPMLITEPAIHHACVVKNTTNYKVPPTLGILAHYRRAIPSECKGKRTTTDKVAFRFKEELDKKLSGLIINS